MFNIGDRVVYPGQGIGVVDTIEKKEFKGKMIDYYQIHLINDTMKLTVPVNIVDKFNVRLISDRKSVDLELEDIEKYFIEDGNLDVSDYKGRMQENLDKLKAGTLGDYLSIICTLTQVNGIKELSTNEKKILNDTKKLVVEEISHSKSLSKIEAEEYLEKIIKC